MSSAQSLLFGNHAHAKHDYSHLVGQLDQTFANGQWEAGRRLLVALRSSHPMVVSDCLSVCAEELLGNWPSGQRWLAKLYHEQPMLQLSSALRYALMQPWPDEPENRRRFCETIACQELERVLVANLTRPDAVCRQLLHQQGRLICHKRASDATQAIAARLLSATQPGSVADQSIIDGLCAGADTIRRSTNGRQRPFTRRSQMLFADLGLVQAQATTMMSDSHGRIHLFSEAAPMAACGHSQQHCHQVLRGSWTSQPCPACARARDAFSETLETFAWSPLDEAEQTQLNQVTTTALAQWRVEHLSVSVEALRQLRHDLWEIRAASINPR
jgi:hypothetical protein